MAKKPAKRKPKPRHRRTKALMNKFLTRIVEGESLRAICRDPKMPGTSMMVSWLNDDAAFAAHYARACEARADALVDEIIEIADDGSGDTYETEDGIVKINTEVVQRSKLRVDARKWVAAKMRPKKYGDKLDVEHQGSIALLKEGDLDL